MRICLMYSTIYRAGGGSVEGCVVLGGWCVSGANGASRRGG